MAGLFDRRFCRVALRTFTDSPDSIRRAEGQGDLAFRNIIIMRIDADEGATGSLQHSLRKMAHRGNGAASAQFNHGQPRGAFRQLVQPLAKPLLLRVGAMAEPGPVAEHQNVGPC